MAAPTNSAESDKAIEESQEMACWYFPPSPPYFSPLSSLFPWSPTDILQAPITEIPPPSAQQEATGNGEIEGTGEDEMAEAGVRETKKSGVRIAIPLEDILQTKGMSLKDAAINLNVSRSILKRVCRGYGITRWPPLKNNKKLISNSRSTEFPTVFAQTQIPLPPAQQEATGNDEIEAVGIECEGTEKDEMAEAV